MRERRGLKSQNDKTYEGQCFCGAVEIEVTGDAAGAGTATARPVGAGPAAPVNAFTL